MVRGYGEVLYQQLPCGLRRTTKILWIDSLGRYLNPGPPEHEAVGSVLEHDLEL